MTTPLDRDLVRRQMRMHRRSLPTQRRAAAMAQFARIIDRALLLRPGRRVAVYFAQAHEADLTRVIRLTRERGCRLYLPSITSYRHHRMQFVRFDPATPLRINRYGIAEPDPGIAPRIAVRQLDVVLLPLLAFDLRGWRLGSGAGFYDRCLHRLRAGRVWRRPRLIGVGYEFQRVAQLDPEPWDVPLDAIVTEEGLHWVRRMQDEEDEDPPRER